MKTNNIEVSESRGAGSKIKLLIFEVIILVGVFYYLQLLADTIAKYTGYPLATYGVPAAICSLFSFLLGKVLKMKGKPLTKFVLITAIVSIAPTTVFTTMLNLMSGPF
jgi:hypothetical protein